MRKLYDQYGQELTLRDMLALDRTDLANRRTWLATARTALALFVSGATFVRFFDHGWLEAVGWVFVIASVPVVGAGWLRYRRMQAEFRRLASHHQPDGPT